MEVCDIIQEALIKTIPKKKKCKKAKWLSEEALQIAEKRSEVKGKGGKEFNPGSETRLDHSELLCNKVLLKYKRDRESF